MDPCLELGDSVYASVCRQGDPLSAVLNQKISSLDMKRWEPAQIKMRVRDTSHLLMILSSVCLWAQYPLWPRHACQLYAVDGDSGEEMLTSSCLTLLESQMRPRVIINIITIIVWSRGFGGWWSFQDLLRRFMSLVGGCGPSVLKPPESRWLRWIWARLQVQSTSSHARLSWPQLLSHSSSRLHCLSCF